MDQTKRLYESLRKPPKEREPETLEEIELRMRTQFNSFKKVLPETQAMYEKLKAEN